MTPLDRGAGIAPSPRAIAIVRERLQQMGFPVSESAARGLLDAVLAVEGPRLYSQLRGAFENSLEIIRDTAESALGTEPGASEVRRRPAAPPPPELPDEEFDNDEPRPVFRRPRR
jgi:hypothetical protein